MTPQRIDRVYELFHEIGALPEADRLEALRGRCGDDRELYNEVQALLKPGVTDSATLQAEVTDSAQLQAGERIGPYKILEQIGEGGFAVVYLAEQLEPVRRRVALKIIKLGMDTKQVVARFEAERQALAMMDHPNVAKVFDAGATETGRPFFVMEHVPGVSITEHCDRQRLNIQERLKLFMQVCDAVQHAHQKGIIHRDLKPSNVMVLTKDGKAVPKVIDFGVAKALHQRLTEKTIFTEQGQLIGTPEYMSPEQAEMTGQDIDTRSDIYALGVLLYELLTGELPFDSAILRRAALGEIQRIIREELPPRPSTRLSEAGHDIAAAARRRHTDPRSLMRLVRSDLDWITMKALEKDRTRRYAAASELAADIARHMRQEPVSAGPPSMMYRAERLVARNRGRVALVTALLALVSLGIAAQAFRNYRAHLSLAQQIRALSIVESEIGRRLAEGSPLVTDPPPRLDGIADDPDAWVLVYRMIANRPPPSFDELVANSNMMALVRRFWERRLHIVDRPMSDLQIFASILGDDNAWQKTDDEIARHFRAKDEMPWALELVKLDHLLWAEMRLPHGFYRLNMHHLEQAAKDIIATEFARPSDNLTTVSTADVVSLRDRLTERLYRAWGYPDAAWPNKPTWYPRPQHVALVCTLGIVPFAMMIFALAAVIRFKTLALCVLLYATILLNLTLLPLAIGAGALHANITSSWLTPLPVVVYTLVTGMGIVVALYRHSAWWLWLLLVAFVLSILLDVALVGLALLSEVSIS